MRAIMLVVAVVIAGCGSMEAPDAGAPMLKAPAAGDSCIGIGSASCTGTRAALFCERSNRLGAYACPGGCTSNTEETRCDFAGAAVGSPCPSHLTGMGQCETSAVIVCDAADGGTFDTPGAWSRRRCDGGCAVVGSSIECRP